MRIMQQKMDTTILRFRVQTRTVERKTPHWQVHYDEVVAKTIRRLFTRTQVPTKFKATYPGLCLCSTVDPCLVNPRPVKGLNIRIPSIRPMRGGGLLIRGLS